MTPAQAAHIALARLGGAAEVWQVVERSGYSPTAVRSALLRIAERDLRAPYAPDLWRLPGWPGWPWSSTERLVVEALVVAARPMTVAELCGVVHLRQGAIRRALHAVAVCERHPTDRRLIVWRLQS